MNDTEKEAIIRYVVGEVGCAIGNHGIPCERGLFDLGVDCDICCLCSHWLGLSIWSFPRPPRRC